MLRKILFYIFVLIYLITCPLIILESLGIIIRPGQQKLMMATGLISVATIPEGASIYVNDTLTPDRSPSILRNLTPGPYKVKITLTDYQTWQKNIMIEKEQVTALENILLIPLKWEKQTLGDQSYKQLIAAEDNRFFLLKSGSALQDLYLFRYKDESIQPLALQSEKPQTTDKILLQQKIIAVQTMPQSPFVLVQLDDEPRTSLWIDTRPGLPKTENISPLLINQPDYILWHKEDDKNIFYSNKDVISLADVDKKTLEPALFNGAKGFTTFEGQLYLVDQDNHFIEMDTNRKTKTSLTGALDQLPPEYLQSSKYLIHLFSEQLLVFLNENGKLLTNKLPYVIAEKDVAGFSKDLVEQQLIFWTKEKLGVVDFTKVRSEGLFDIGPSIRWLVLNGRNIRQAFWVNGGSHILYLDNNHVRIVEATDTQKPFISDVTDAAGDIAYSDKLGKLFYLDPRSQQLTSLTIRHPREFITFKLPKNLQKKEIK